MNDEIVKAAIEYVRAERALIKAIDEDHTTDQFIELEVAQDVAWTNLCVAVDGGWERVAEKGGWKS